MRTPNYRQAKRNREETRKQKHQQKLERKQRAPESPPSTDVVPPVAEKGTEDAP